MQLYPLTSPVAPGPVVVCPAPFSLRQRVAEVHERSIVLHIHILERAKLLRIAVVVCQSFLVGGMRVKIQIRTNSHWMILSFNSHSFNTHVGVILTSADWFTAHAARIALALLLLQHLVTATATHLPLSRRIRHGELPENCPHHYRFLRAEKILISLRYYKCSCIRRRCRTTVRQHIDATPAVH